MIYNSEWEYENQDYLREQYEKKMQGENPYHRVRKIYCKGCGRVFYTNIETKKYCLYSLCGNHGYQKELKWRRTQERKDRICQTCGNTFTPKRSDAKFCCNACRQKAYRESVTDAARCQADTLAKCNEKKKMLQIRQVVTLTTYSNRNENSVTVEQVPKSGTYNNRNDIKLPKGDELHESAL